MPSGKLKKSLSAIKSKFKCSNSSNKKLISIKKSNNDTNQIDDIESESNIEKSTNSQESVLDDLDHDDDDDEEEDEEESNENYINKKCKGYKPILEYQSDGLYSNFPFQAIDLDRENIKFVIENETFHNLNCAKNDYQLQKGNRNSINKLCSDLSYNKYLQNILKRSQINSDFSSIPHCYLTYNQLKKELDHYRESLKKLKLENLNLKRTIDSLRTKEENYKRFVNLLAQKDYTKLNQIITVCLNQKKGINGIIEKLLDTDDGVYHPREKNVAMSIDDVNCKICDEKVNIFKMRDHIGKHIQNSDVVENSNRCGFCGLTENCTIGIKVTQGKSNSSQAYWPESNCTYFKNFNLKMSNKSNKSLLSSNRPVECNICKKVIWSFNMKSHFSEVHIDTEPPDLLSEEENASRSDDVKCKICSAPWNLAKMRDHVAKHILMKDAPENSLCCGFCGLVGCDIQIKVTSGKGKNTTYGPASNCPFFRKFNLKSSFRPTKSSPSTNRPIECHICKQVYWSYNMRIHFLEQHHEEEPPELITELEKEMVLKN